MRILKDYNQYVMRNLARGYSRKDLGVSYVKVRHFFVVLEVLQVVTYFPTLIIFIRRNNCKLI